MAQTSGHAPVFSFNEVRNAEQEQANGQTSGLDIQHGGEGERERQQQQGGEGVISKLEGKGQAAPSPDTADKGGIGRHAEQGAAQRAWHVGKNREQHGDGGTVAEFAGVFADGVERLGIQKVTADFDEKGVRADVAGAMIKNGPATERG